LENRLTGGNADLEYDYKIIEIFLRMSQPQTKADSDLQPKLQRQALTCGNAMLAAVLLSELNGLLNSCLL